MNALLDPRGPATVAVRFGAVKGLCRVGRGLWREVSVGATVARLLLRFFFLLRIPDRCERGLWLSGISVLSGLSSCKGGSLDRGLEEAGTGVGLRSVLAQSARAGGKEEECGNEIFGIGMSVSRGLARFMPCGIRLVAPVKAGRRFTCSLGRS